MRTTLYLKIADLATQVLTILIPLIMGIVMAEPGVILIAYFFIGCAQLLSAFLNSVFLDVFYKHEGRRIYNWGLVAAATWAAIHGGADLDNYPLIISFFVFCGFMAIGYLYISYAETAYLYKLGHREQYTRI